MLIEGKWETRPIRSPELRTAGVEPGVEPDGDAVTIDVTAEGAIELLKLGRSRMKFR